jgi:rod shape determining protein RodA
VRLPELDRRLGENFNWRLLFCLAALAVFGLVNLYSVSGGELGLKDPFTRQALFGGLGLLAMAGSLLIDYRWLRKAVWPLLILSLAGLVLVSRYGVMVNGAKRWLDVGLVRFQPSEMVKFASIIILAAHLARREYKGGLGFKDLLIPFLIIIGPAVLIAKQPDVGTALHLVVSSVALILFRRPKMRVLATFGVLALSGTVWLFGLGGLGWLVKHEVIRSYHVQRYDTFLAPEKDPTGRGWQIIQSKNAIGSGQVTGRGFMDGPQQKFGFLPAAETDFAFAALAEEWGFLGAIALLAVFLLMLWTMMGTSARSGDAFGAMLALGMASVLFWQIAINVAMCLGLFPVVGIPLPLISYGGTSLVTIILAVGLVLNVGMRRFLFLDKPMQATSRVWIGVPLAKEPTVQVRSLSPYDPKEPEPHPAHRLPHRRPWLKHLIRKDWVGEFNSSAPSTFSS